MIGTRDQELITRILKAFADDNEALMAQLMDIQYYFRGCTREDAWAMTRMERDRYIGYLNKRFKEISEIAKKTGQIPPY